jgi:hypothetical protein
MSRVTEDLNVTEDFVTEDFVTEDPSVTED